MMRSGSRCPALVDQRTASPNGSWDAVVFHFSCGIGRRGTRNVSVLLAGDSAYYPANLFSVTDSTGMALLGSNTEAPKIEVHWESDSVLTVRYPAGARPLLRMAAANGVRAAFAEISP